jgi:hypothetical protein
LILKNWACLFWSSELSLFILIIRTEPGWSSRTEPVSFGPQNGAQLILENWACLLWSSELSLVYLTELNIS